MQHRLWTRRGALRMAGIAAISVAYLDGFGRSSPRPGAVRGYGRDPNLLERTVTWPRTLTLEQLQVLTSLCNIILPAEPPHPSAADVAAEVFLDEWLSAPYPDMRADRRIILEGLNTLDADARRKWGIPFHEVDSPQKLSIFDQWSSGNDRQVLFCRRVIALVCAGYYTTRQGHAALGYIGNVGRMEFPGPPPEIVHRLQEALREKS